MVSPDDQGVKIKSNTGKFGGFVVQFLEVFFSVRLTFSISRRKTWQDTRYSRYRYKNQRFLTSGKK